MALIGSLIRDLMMCLMLGMFHVKLLHQMKHLRLPVLPLFRKAIPYHKVEKIER